VLPKNGLLKHVIERKLETTRRRGRRRTKLLDNFKERKRHWNSKKKTVDCTLWRSRFERGYGPCRKTDQEMNGFTKSVMNFPTHIISLYGSSPFFFTMEMKSAYIEVGKNDI
jgi:hypothetical protein